MTTATRLVKPIENDMSTDEIRNCPVNMASIEAAERILAEILVPTPLQINRNLSRRFNAEVYLKREDLQIVRSYKIRGAYNKMRSMAPTELALGVVCASAGNHAQGVAFSCRALEVKGLIVMPVTTPGQKVQQVQLFGEGFVEVLLTGDTFDDAYLTATRIASERGMNFIHPFDDWKVIEGQGTVGLEIIESCPQKADFLFLPVGGGGLGAGVGLVYAELSASTRIIGVEPAGASSMKTSLDNGEVTILENIDKFVDGAAVKKVGDKTFSIFKKLGIEVITVPEGKVCTTILKLYNEEAIVAEPAGALTIACLDQFKNEISGKTVVCILSGGNNDITRTEEIRERSMLYEGLKHYFIVRFAQRAGALREFLELVLGPNDDIVHFEYSKKSSREKGAAVVGLELKDPEDLEKLLGKMADFHINYEYLNNNPEMLQYLL